MMRHADQSEKPSLLLLVIEALNRAVRPLSTFELVAAVIYFTYIGLIDPQTFAPIAIMAISFWFGVRQGEKDRDQMREELRERTTQVVELAKQLPPTNGGKPPEPPPRSPA